MRPYESPEGPFPLEIQDDDKYVGCNLPLGFLDLLLLKRQLIATSHVK